MNLIVKTCLMTMVFLASAPAHAAQSESGIEGALAAFVDDFAGVVRVERDGAPIFERAYGLADYAFDVPNTPQTLFRLQALSRPLTAAVAHRAAEQGVLDLDASICAYISPCPPAWTAVKVRHLLNQSSGLPDLSASMTGAWTGDLGAALDKALMTGRDTEPGWAPGSRYRDSRFDYVLTARILEVVYGASYQSIMQAQLFRPAGMSGAGVSLTPAAIKTLAAGYMGRASAPEWTDPASALLPGAGGVYATAADLGDFAQALFGERLTTAKMLDALVTPDFALSSRHAYGLITTDKGGLLSHAYGGRGGGYSGWMSYYPDHGVTVIILSNQGFAPVDSIRKALEKVMFGGGA